MVSLVSSRFWLSPKVVSSPFRRPARILSLLLIAAVITPQLFRGQDASPASRSFSLGQRAHVTLATDWSQRLGAEPPPLPLLAASARRFRFTDSLVLEDRKAPAVLEVGFSDNPFLASDASGLETRMREQLAADLFYFFFPAPRGCLARAKSAFEEARRKEDRRLSEERRDEKEPVRRPSVVLTQACEFSPTPLDFYAAQLSPGIVMRETREGDRVEPQLRGFYHPPMELVEIGNKTFFIFEAQAGRIVDRAEIERFGLPDDLQGARARFFWAIGAENPFPFLRDPHRKDLQLIHVVYARLSFDEAARADFRKRLAGIRWEP